MECKYYMDGCVLLIKILNNSLKSFAVIKIIAVRSHYCACFLFLFISSCYISHPRVDKIGTIYHICNIGGVNGIGIIIRSDPSDESPVVYRAMKGDYLKKIDESGLWIEVGITEAGQTETCCGFGWVSQEELKRSTSGCDKK